MKASGPAMIAVLLVAFASATSSVTGQELGTSSARCTGCILTVWPDQATNCGMPGEPNSGTVELRCQATPVPGTQVTWLDPDPTRTTVGFLPCNNCNSCNHMYCVRTFVISWGSSGTVSGTLSISRQFQATFNRILAPAIGVHMTTEFEFGLSRTTSLSESDQIACGSTDIAPCSWTDYTITRTRQDGWSTVAPNGAPMRAVFGRVTWGLGLQSQTYAANRRSASMA